MSAARASKRTQGRKTKRTVYFYRLHSGADGAGGFLPYSIASASTVIGALGVSDGDRYLDESDDTFLTAWCDNPDGEVARLRLATVRRGDLPRVERGGALSPLNIAGDAGLAEITHFAVFNNGITGVLFNFYGPRPTKLPFFLSAKCPEPLDHVFLDALLRPDLSAQLARLKDIRMIDIGVQHGQEAILADVDEGLAQVLEGARRFTDAQRVRVVLQPEAYSRKGLGRRALGIVKHLAGMTRERDLLDRFVIKGFDPSQSSVVDIDVLKELLVSRQEVVFADKRSRALSDDSAYDAIHRAYAELRDDLGRAATVRGPPRSS